MNEVAVVETGRNVANVVENDTLEFVTFRIADQLFGVHVLKVQDILRPEDIAFVPLAPPEVKGSINLRGRIVTVIDVRVRLGLSENESQENNMGVTVEQKNELYTLLVDEIGEVLAQLLLFVLHRAGIVDDPQDIDIPTPLEVDLRDGPDVRKAYELPVVATGGDRDHGSTHEPREVSRSFSHPSVHRGSSPFQKSRTLPRVRSPPSPSGSPPKAG